MRNFINHIIKYIIACFLVPVIFGLPMMLSGAIVFYGLEYEEKQFGILKAIDNFIGPNEWAQLLFIAIGGMALIFLMFCIFYFLGGRKLMDWSEKMAEKIDKMFPTKSY